MVFLTDAISVLEALNKGGESELTDSLKSLAETQRVAIQYIPTHSVIPENEADYSLAKEGVKVQIEQDMDISRGGPSSSPTSERVLRQMFIIPSPGIFLFIPSIFIQYKG